MPSAAVVHKHLLHSKCKVKTEEHCSHPGALGVSEHMQGGGLHSAFSGPAGAQREQWRNLPSWRKAQRHLWQNLTIKKIEFG